MRCLAHKEVLQYTEKQEARYNKLWKILIDRKMKKTDLIELAGVSTTTLAKLSKDEYVSMEILYRICKSLNCNIGDITEFIFE